MLFSSSAVKIYISDIWNPFPWQSWPYHWPNGQLVKQFTFGSQADSISKNWWNHIVAVPSSKINILNWDGGKMNPKQFYVICFHLQLMGTCFSTMLCCLKQIKYIGFKIFENREHSELQTLCGHQKAREIETRKEKVYIKGLAVALF